MGKFRCIETCKTKYSVCDVSYELTAGKVYEGERLSNSEIQVAENDRGLKGIAYFSKHFQEVHEPPVPPQGLPLDAKARKALPICTGCLDYFPDALAAVAEVSRIGNEQHNPGQPLHWERGKSNDQEDALLRHLIDRGKLDTDGVRHSAKVAWRALALLQLEIEASRGVK